MVKVKELNFYNNDRNWARGRRWYESHFRNCGTIRGDVNPNYAMFPLCNHVPQRMHQLYPDCKIVFLVRDPVERLLSHIHHNWAVSKEDRKLERICSDLEIGVDPYNYLGVSRYFMQASQFLNCYSRQHFHFIRSSELRNNRVQSVNRLLTFLGLDGLEASGVLDETSHESSRKRKHSKWMHQLFTSRRFGGVIGKVIASSKKILPVSVYETARSAVLRPVRNDPLGEKQAQRIRELLDEDIVHFAQLTGIRF